MDDDLITCTASLGAITAQALAVARDVPRSSAQAQLQAACRAGLLSARRPLQTGPTLYTTTAAGRRATGKELEPCRVTKANATHLMAVAAVWAVMCSRHPDHVVEGERDLRARERAAGHALASARVGVAPDGSPRLHRPDLVLWPADGLPVAVEVELTVKAPARLRAIVLAWARCRRVAGTLYYATEGAQRAVARAIEQTSAHDQVLLIPLASLLQTDSTVPSGA